jgi:hypothetical protein
MICGTLTSIDGSLVTQKMLKLENFYDWVPILTFMQFFHNRLHCIIIFLIKNLEFFEASQFQFSPLILFHSR